jgi:hypothetical protein
MEIFREGKIMKSYWFGTSDLLLKIRNIKAKTQCVSSIVPSEAQHHRPMVFYIRHCYLSISLDKSVLIREHVAKRAT